MLARVRHTVVAPPARLSLFALALAALLWARRAPAEDASSRDAVTLLERDVEEPEPRALVDAQRQLEASYEDAPEPRSDAHVFNSSIDEGPPYRERGDGASALEPRSQAALSNAEIRDAGLTDAGLTNAGLTDARAGPSPTVAAPGARARPPVGHVARVAFGLCALFALAMIAAHPKVRAFEKRAGFGMFATTALPFITLGAIARHPSVGVLSPSVVNDLRPALEFGLGWIGFRVGAEYDVRTFDRMPNGVRSFIAANTGIAFVATSAAVLLALAPFVWPVNASILRDALLLGACAAVSAPTGARALERAGAFGPEASKLLRHASRLDDAIPMLVLALVTAVFRDPARVRFTLPPLGWVFLQVGMGVTLGFVLLAARASARSHNERSALTLGGVAFSAGMAQYLGFSPLVVAFCAGVIIASLRDAEDDFGQLLLDLERPIYLTFFALVGATWTVARIQAWVLVLAYVGARSASKFLGPRLYALPSSPPPSLVGVAMQPSSVVAVAVIVSAHALYPELNPVYETVVLVGALLSELLTQGLVALWKRNAPPPPEVTVSDEDDEVLL